MKTSFISPEHFFAWTEELQKEADNLLKEAAGKPAETRMAYLGASLALNSIVKSSIKLLKGEL